MCLNFGPARFDFNHLKPFEGKLAYLGGCFRFLIGAFGVAGVCLAHAGVGLGMQMQRRGFVNEFRAYTTSTV